MITTIRKFLPFACAAALAAPLGAKPLKVYILAGQSNMQGHAHERTLSVVGLDPKTAPMLKEIQNPDGTAKVHDKIWVSSIGSSESEKVGKLTVGFGPEKGGPKIGPELTFGIYMQKFVNEPIVIIKTAWGGKSIHTDFRSPSAGPFVFREEEIENFKKQGKDVAKIKAERAQATGHYYRLMMEYVQKVLSDLKRVYPGYKASDGYELAGFVWFQGWNDMVNRGVYPKRDQPGGYDQYSEVLAHFIRDVRKDLKAPKMPFVIGVMGAGGAVAKYTPDKKRYAGIHQNFRNAMAAPAKLPEFQGNVAAVWTENYWDDELEQLRYKDRQLQNEWKKTVAEKKLSRQEDRDGLEKLRAKEFDERERKILKDGASNAEYHYLGSAKVLGGIGKGFAEAVHELSK